jgi:uncharacterized cupin superfamily protein
MTDQTITIPRFNVHDESNFEPLPEYNGHQALLYKSEDGLRVAGSFKEHGQYDHVNEFDEFLYVIAGSTKVSVEGAEPFVLKAGDCCYLRKGLVISFEHDDDFHDVAVLMRDTPES